MIDLVSLTILLDVPGVRPTTVGELQEVLNTAAQDLQDYYALAKRPQPPGVVYLRGLSRALPMLLATARA